MARALSKMIFLESMPSKMVPIDVVVVVVVVVVLVVAVAAGCSIVLRAVDGLQTSAAFGGFSVDRGLQTNAGFLGPTTVHASVHQKKLYFVLQLSEFNRIPGGWR